MKLIKKLLIGLLIFCVAVVVLSVIFGEDSEETLPETTVTQSQEETQNSEEHETEESTLNTNEQSAYMKLAQNKDEYLLFLRMIGNAYKYNSLSNEMFDEMATHEEVLALVEDVLFSRYNNGKLSPEFQESFSAFWTDDMAENETETLKALEYSFDISYNFATKRWIIEENEEAAAFHTVYEVNGEKYRDFEGRIQVGDIIYLKDENKMIPYFEVLAFGENMDLHGDGISENTVQLKELYSIMGEDLTTYWRDLDDMLEHNKETRDETGYPVYFIKE